jgi:hypothetical protein
MDSWIDGFDGFVGSGLMEKDCEQRDFRLSFLPDMEIEPARIQRLWQPVG